MQMNWAIVLEVWGFCLGKLWQITAWHLQCVCTLSPSVHMCVWEQTDIIIKVAGPTQQSQHLLPPTPPLTSSWVSHPTKRGSPPTCCLITHTHTHSSWWSLLVLALNKSLPPPLNTLPVSDCWPVQRTLINPAELREVSTGGMYCLRVPHQSEWVQAVVCIYFMHYYLVQLDTNNWLSDIWWLGKYSVCNLTIGMFTFVF